MAKYRLTICQSKGFSGGMWFFSPVDLRKRFYFCNHCQGHHLVKEGLVKDKSFMKPSENLMEVNDEQ